jgi:predicted amidohydrolase YtcJ
LIDAHGHVLEHGYYAQLPLLGSRSTEEVVTRVESFLANDGRNLPEGSWVEGMGWDQNLFPSKTFPTADDLEASPILRGKKICLARVDVHAEWVSKAVLDELEKRKGGLPDSIEGGLIVRDGQGRPTGIFVSASFTDDAS